jgi:hypothetical protein
VEKRAMMLAAIEAVTKTHPVWEARRHNSDVTAQTTARESLHVTFPVKIERAEGLQRAHCHCNQHRPSPSKLLV